MNRPNHSNPSLLFENRHLGLSAEDVQEMLRQIGCENMETLIAETIPASIRLEKKPDLPPEGKDEYTYLKELRKLAAENDCFKNYIGQGYFNCIVPTVIQRNVFENPGWYTQYTPYQAEISQGRLEALFNFQTTVSDLTALSIANASLLDEGTAAAEAMVMLRNQHNKKNRADLANVFLVAEDCYCSTIEVLKTRAEPLGIEVKIKAPSEFNFDDNVFGCLLQYPTKNGGITDYRNLVKKAHAKGIYVTVATDLMALTLLKPPGQWGADVAVGSAQRFGVPIGYGGPHAAFFSCTEEFKRLIPGRIIGLSKDRRGKAAYRMALQTREQHIRREKATSNICTAQALLAIMTGFYAVYHGKEGLSAIARSIHSKAVQLNLYLKRIGYKCVSENFFDTLSIPVDDARKEKIRELALGKGVNFWYDRKGYIGVSLDETTSERSVRQIANIFGDAAGNRLAFEEKERIENDQIPSELKRSGDFLNYPSFQKYRTETEMLRYIKLLESRDLSLTHSMIPLGSCTMKLNPTTTLIPVSWPEFADIHPLAPLDQVKGYMKLFQQLEKHLSEITGLAACSLQPNSGAQGEYTGLRVIDAFHNDRGEGHRNVVLIPSSAHGTNPASAVLSGMKVVVVKCDEHGNIDLTDLKAKAEAHRSHLSALMITYPSTHGIFEEDVQEVCEVIHRHGGQVYMDGANMNAQLGLTSPGRIGADVCHLNLHKTFSIPHGGGGPGMGPICVARHLEPYLPTHHFIKNKSEGVEKAISAVASAPWSSASILPISYGFIELLGLKGLKKSAEVAILSANYIKARLEKHYDVLYAGKRGRVAHELIIDFRPFKREKGVEVEDIAKRLMDYGFHAPTMSFPVPGTMMIEPTESESKESIDRFCDALISIKKEIEAIGSTDIKESILRNAPHTLEELIANDWQYSYSRTEAAYPQAYLRQNKFWPSVSRVDNSFGDRNLVCSCPPVEDYVEGW